MKFWKNAFHLVIIYCILFTAFFVVSELIKAGLPFSTVMILLTCGFIISLISLYIFSAGYRKNVQNMLLLTLSAVGIKLLLYLALVLVFYFISKINGTAFLITFFIIYLSFTYYLLKIFIQTLKSKKSTE